MNKLQNTICKVVGNSVVVTIKYKSEPDGVRAATLQTKIMM